MVDTLLAQTDMPMWFTWIVLPLLIFCARIMDVSLGTVRLVLISRGFRYIAPIVGFFEITIWVIAIGQIMRNMSNPLCYIAYGGGFATGTFLGILISEKLSLGNVMVRMLTTKQSEPLIEELKANDYGITTLEGQGARGPVHIIFSIVPKRESTNVIKILNKHNPNAFYSIEDVDSVKKGVFPHKKRNFGIAALNRLRSARKGK